MSSRSLLFRFTLLVIFLLISLPGVSGWTFQSWSVSPAVSELPPGTPVKAAFSLHFDSWETGSTFEKDNSLTMYTGLSNPQWVVRKIEAMEDQSPIIEPVPVRQTSLVRLDSWTLSYSGKRFDLSVQLTGTIPALNESGEISVIKLQEMTPGARPVAGSLVQKQIHVVVPTPEPVVTPGTPAIDLTPEATRAVTMVPAAPVTPAKR